MQLRKNAVSKSNVAIGWLGVELDSRGSVSKSKKWRPSISLVQHSNFTVHQFDLLYQPAHRDLAEEVKADIKKNSPSTKVVLHEIKITAPRNFPAVYEALQNFADQYKFDLERNNYFVHLTTGTYVFQISMFLLTEAHVIPASLVQTSPPRGRKAASTFEILDVGDPKFLRIRSRTQNLQVKLGEESFLKDGIETRNPKFNRLIDQVTHVALRSTRPILLLGPSGAGKSKLAQRIYDLKRDRKQITGPFVPVNCATIRGDGAMSELFGHERGSFTGAQKKRSGHLKSADKGILFLDEIGDLKLEEQAMLLRALDTQLVRPFGSDKEEHSDFQLIAGTNKNLKLLVQKGEFREDLLARIDHWKFILPGLRERAEDIEPNIQFELGKYIEKHKRDIQFTPGALKMFLSFATLPEATWKRNFRDLARAIDRMAVLAPHGRINEAIVSDEIEKLREDWREVAEFDEQRVIEKLVSKDKLQALDLFKQIQLEGVIKICLECRSLPDASRRLFAHSSAQKASKNDSDRLRKYLKTFGLDWQQIKNY